MLNKKIFLVIIFFLLIINVQAETQTKLAELDSSGNLKSLDIITSEDTYKLAGLFGEKGDSKAFLFPKGTRIQKYQDLTEFNKEKILSQLGL